MATIDNLKQNLEDLEIELRNAIEHGDFVEDQLVENNKQLEEEVEKRVKSEERLKQLVELLSTQKDDLEILVESIIAHGDEIDYQWIDKLNEAEHQTLIDPLSKIANRRKFDQYFEREWNRSCRNQSHLSLLIIDIDYFKKYNDHYGHIHGDIVIQKVAECISKQISRPADELCRYGGEEFALILPDTDLKGSIQLASRINMAIEKEQILHEASKVSDFITVSIGVDAIVPVDVEGRILFFEHVDNLLYEAKQQGRNSVISSIQCPDIKAKQVATYFDYIDYHHNYHKENLNLSFVPSSISIKQRWRNNGLSADFLSDYVSTFFPVSDDDEESASKQANIINTVAFIANELLENVMKYSAADCLLASGIQLFIHHDSLVFYSTNFITEKNSNIFQKFINKLTENDPMDLMMEQLEYNALNDSSSGLGFLTMINDYEADLSWKFETNRQEYIKVVSRVEIKL